MPHLSCLKNIQHFSYKRRLCHWVLSVHYFPYSFVSKIPNCSLQDNLFFFSNWQADFCVWHENFIHITIAYVNKIKHKPVSKISLDQITGFLNSGVTYKIWRFPEFSKNRFQSLQGSSNLYFKDFPLFYADDQKIRARFYDQSNDSTFNDISSFWNLYKISFSVGTIENITFANDRSIMKALTNLQTYQANVS